jgi:hypothetical protein
VGHGQKVGPWPEKLAGPKIFGRPVGQNIWPAGRPEKLAGRPEYLAGRPARKIGRPVGQNFPRNFHEISAKFQNLIFDFIEKKFIFFFNFFSLSK